MARRSAHRSTIATRQGALPNANYFSYPSSVSPSVYGRKAGVDFSTQIFRPLDVDDGRLWHPDPDHGAFTVGNRWARVVVHKRPIIAYSKPIWAYRGIPVGLQVPVGVRFESPFKVMTCIRRKMRRAVIFALRRAGAGARAKRHRRSWRSSVWC